MKNIWKSTIAKSLLGSFLVFLIPLTVFGLAINYYSMGILQREVLESYNNSLNILLNQINNNLEKFEQLSYAIILISF